VFLDGILDIMQRSNSPIDFLRWCRVGYWRSLLREFFRAAGDQVLSCFLNCSFFHVFKWGRDYFYITTKIYDYWLNVGEPYEEATFEHHDHRCVPRGICPGRSHQ
jgi:hypothetical protein